jgi:uncharacterized protein YoxC
VTVGNIVGLIFAVGFVLLVGLLAVPILRLGQTLDQAARTLADLTDHTGPLLSNVTTTVDNVNATLTDVHGQLLKVDTMTTNIAQVTTNVTALTSLFAATAGGPLVKVAAFTYGVRRAATARRKADVERQVRSQIKASRRAARHRREES